MLVYIQQFATGEAVTFKIVRNQLVVISNKSKLRYRIPAEYVFDLLKDNLSLKSKSLPIRRRALQLNGLSLNEAIDSL